MKRHNITGISQLSVFLQAAYNKLNERQFNGKLPHLLITFESGAKSTLMDGYTLIKCGKHQTVINTA